MILLLWFRIFKLISVFISNELFVFSLSSDLKFLTQFSGNDLFTYSDIQFLLSSIVFDIVWLSIKVLIVFVPYIVYLKYITYQKWFEKSGF